LLQYRYTSHQLLARHTNLSLLRSLPASFNFFVPKLRWYLNLPHKFYLPHCSNSCRNIYSINNRLRKTISNTRYLQFIIYFIYDITLVLPALHSLWGFKQNDCFNHT
jgi:hypothetical protein